MSYQYKTEDIAQSLREHHGYVHLAAESLGCAAKTIYRRLENVQWLREELDSIRGYELDITELALRRAILAGEGWAIALKLRTQGKDRGYTERHEVTGREGEPITFVIKEREPETDV